MTKQDLAALALRISSPFLLFFSLSKVFALLPNWIEAANGNMFLIFGILLFALMPISIAFIFWKYAYRLANLFIPEQNGPVPDTKWSLGEIQATAFVIVGLYALVSAIPDTFFLISVMFQASSFDVGYFEIPPTLIASMISTGIRLVLGFWLLLGANGLLDFLKKIKASGQNAPPSSH